MTPQEWLTAVSTVGFPIVLSGYLLLRVEKSIKEHTEALNRVCQALDIMAERRQLPRE